MGKSWENPLEHGEIMGKPMGAWENHGKTHRNMGKSSENPWENVGLPYLADIF